MLDVVMLLSGCDCDWLGVKLRLETTLEFGVKLALRLENRLEFGVRFTLSSILLMLPEAVCGCCGVRTELMEVAT